MHFSIISVKLFKRFVKKIVRVIAFSAFQCCNNLSVKIREIFMERRGLKDFQVGESFTGFCVVRKKELKHKKSGEPYLALELGDRSGRLRGKVWKNGINHYQDLSVGQLIKVKGKIRSFMDSKELNIERLRAARKEEQSILKDIVPVSRKDIEGLRGQFKVHLEGIENPHLAGLLEVLFPDETALENYLETPSGKLWHHNYLYGMLEHLICLLDLADVMCRHYPTLKTDVLKTGIILHNLGKSADTDYDEFIEYTTEGRLIGHTVLGYEILSEAIKKKKEFPEKLKLALFHLLLSHHGTPDKGSPVVPMTLEAIVFQYIKEADIQANAALRIIENDRLPESEWTRFNNLFNRFLYVGQETENDEPDEQHD